MRQRLTFAAKAYGVPERTVRRWVHQERLTAVKRGGIYYLDMTELGQLVELQHAGGGRLDRTPSGRYAVLHSVNYSRDSSPAVDSTPMSGALL